MFDLLIKRGMIYDGKQGNAYHSDIGVKDGHIEKIANLDSYEAVDTIDANGLIVMPGFIDPHTHSDTVLLHDPQRASAVSQGITTEFTGSCGLGVLPMSKENRIEFEKTIGGLLGVSTRDIEYNSVNGYFNYIGSTGLNVGVQVPHSCVRMEAAGYHDIPLKGKRLEHAKELMRRAIEEGAVAFTTGLAFYPASFSDFEEVAELCSVAAEYDIPLCVHQRTALRNPERPFDPREEVLELARQTGVRVHFSHYRTNAASAGKTDALIEPIERGLSEGLSVTAELYPYHIGCSFALAFLPMWAMDGGYDVIIDRLTKTDTKNRIIAHIDSYYPNVGNGVFTHTPGHPEYLGHSFKEIATLRGESVPQMICNVLAEEALAFGFRYSSDCNEETLKQLDKDYIELIKKPYYMVGSDTEPGQMYPHPRTYGTFVKILRLAREYGLDWSVIANRLAGLPARVFNIKGRGIIAEGYFADMVILNPETVADTATFRFPASMPKGIEYVIVNGRTALRRGKFTGVLAGAGIRRNNNK